MKEKKFTFSKRVTVACFLIFGACLVRALTMDYTSVVDTAVMVACVSMSGSMCVGCLKHYFQKSQSENIPKIQTGVYKDTMDIRYEYNKKMMELKKQYGMSNEEVFEIESESNMDELSETVLDMTIQEVHDDATKAHEDIEIEGI